MKIILRLLGVIVGVLFLLCLALIVHPLWLGPAVKLGAVKLGPKYTGTPIALADCDVNLYGTRVAVGGFELANPDVCSDKTAVRVDTFRVEVDPKTVASDVIVVKDITLTGVYVSYVKATPEKYNFDVIADNLAAATGGEAAAKPAADEPAGERTEPAAGDGKKVIIEKLTIGDLTVSYLGFPIPVPGTLVLTDIGKSSQGVSWEGAGKEIVAEIQQKLKTAGAGLLTMGQQGLDLGTSGVTNALNAAMSLDVEKAKAILKGTGGDIKSLGKDMKSLGKDLGKDLKSLFK